MVLKELALVHLQIIKSALIRPFSFVRTYPTNSVSILKDTRACEDPHIDEKGGQLQELFIIFTDTSSTKDFRILQAEF